eukprot:TRINITY_DN10370_c0_g3_i1.p1 TRINITY_DN10370_c0_g3~~TRINITY_DN10370_c0_g3_i1.p1  ORF type:complete len:164 (+),score=21.86 TRINITY_DN10370_c0_g3_i1:215-706(+)
MKLIHWTLLLLFAALFAVLNGDIQEDTVSACRNSYWNLEPLRRDDSDYESSAFRYLGLKWVAVFNFCRDTVRSCMWSHYPAFLNAKGKGLRCLPTLTSGDWESAEFSLEYNNGIKVARVSWASKLKGGFEMWIRCNRETDYRFIRMDIEDSPWVMYMESKFVC